MGHVLSPRLTGPDPIGQESEVGAGIALAFARGCRMTCVAISVFILPLISSLISLLVGRAVAPEVVPAMRAPSIGRAGAHRGTSSRQKHRVACERSEPRSSSTRPA
jgi:hypothetical protein